MPASYEPQVLQLLAISFCLKLHADKVSHSPFHFRSLPKSNLHDDDGGGGHTQVQVSNFEPIPHEHDFCERVVINVSTGIRVYEWRWNAALGIKKDMVFSHMLPL